MKIMRQNMVMPTLVVLASALAASCGVTTVLDSVNSAKTQRQDQGGIATNESDLSQAGSGVPAGSPAPNSNANSSNATGVSDPASSGEEEQIAELPSVVSGAYLACRWLTQDLKTNPRPIFCALRDKNHQAWVSGASMSESKTTWYVTRQDDRDLLASLQGVSEHTFGVPNFEDSLSIEVEVSDAQGKSGKVSLPLSKVEPAPAPTPMPTPDPSVPPVTPAPEPKPATNPVPIAAGYAEKELKLKATCRSADFRAIRWWVENKNPNPVLVVVTGASEGQAVVPAGGGYLDTASGLTRYLIASLRISFQKSRHKWESDSDTVVPATLRQCSK